VGDWTIISEKNVGQQKLLKKVMHRKPWRKIGCLLTRTCVQLLQKIIAQTISHPKKLCTSKGDKKNNQKINAQTIA